MAKNDLLNFLKDINYVYKDCGMYDSVSKMLDGPLSRFSAN